MINKKELWLRDMQRDDGFPPAVLSMGTGRTLRTFASGSIPVFRGSRVFLIKNGVLIAADARTGKKLWSTKADGHLSMARVVSGDRLYAGTGLGQVFGYDTETGKQVWHSSAGAPVGQQLEDGIQTATYAPQAMSIGGGVLVVPANTRITVFR